ncbi:MAG: pilus assembly protein TadG-related protein [Verrucomicrobiae bacterium]|nr:pilus assembly protein TadG-related protein [Verrucomicrobiae bacterium]
MYRNSWRRLPSRRSSGQTLVVVAIAMVALIGMLGFIFDTSRVELHRRQTQSAADAAAQAAAFQLLGGLDRDRIEAARATAVSYASDNGVSAANVMVEIPPAAGPHANRDGFVRVRTIHNVNATLSRVFSSSPTMEVAAYATAGVVSIPIGSTMVVLDPTQRSALRVYGDGTFYILSAPAYVNSRDTEAVSIEGPTRITAETLSVAGGVDYPVKVSGRLQTGGLAVPDPFAHLVAPIITSRSEARLPDGTKLYTSPDSGGTAAWPALADIDRDKTLRPGIYWGGIAISKRATVTLQPGVYIMAGGGFSVYGKRTVVSGRDVFIYNTRNPYQPDGAGAYGNCIVSNSAVTLEAPTMASNPAYAGLLIFNDRSSSATISFDNRTSEILRNSLPDQAPIKGFIYSANGRVAIHDGGGSAGMGVVARTVTVEDGGTLGLADRNRIPRVPTVRLVD